MRKEKRILNALNQVDEKYIEEAASDKKASQRPAWVKWTSIAACFALIAVLGVGSLQGGWFSGKDVAKLDNGEAISFAKCDEAASSLDLDYYPTIRALTAEEIAALFGNLPVTANAAFNSADDELVGFDGKIGDMKMIITTSDLPLSDTVIVGSEESSQVDGVSVTAGYFLTDPNSRGEQTAIYFATFKLGDSNFYVENSGAKADREGVKTNLAKAVQQLIANGALDLSQF